MASSDNPSPVVRAAARSNILLLAQGVELIDRLGPQRYVQTTKACFGSSAGGHFRHSIEHYQSLLQALTTGEIDYEGRARDSSIESHAEHARRIMGELAVRLQDMVSPGEADRTLTVRSETVVGETLSTSLGRELEFLISHTVHHYALIAIIVGGHGVILPEDFGLAPSTLKFQQNQSAACAL